ncbi:MAG: hypothetical protein HQL41_02910 [Alphaproteobacteria bacterium]|nr:hypothetical protein [Alphaproteobacteria bacterium]
MVENIHAQLHHPLCAHTISAYLGRKADNVGGPYGFMAFLEAALNPAHPEHRRMLEWYGGPFRPDDIDEAQIRRILGWIAYRRRGPLASQRDRRGRTR